jgi:hypothetical protein
VSLTTLEFFFRALERLSERAWRAATSMRRLPLRLALLDSDFQRDLLLGLEARSSRSPSLSMKLSTPILTSVSVPTTAVGHELRAVSALDEIKHSKIDHTVRAAGAWAWTLAHGPEAPDGSIGRCAMALMELWEQAATAALVREGECSDSPHAPSPGDWLLYLLVCRGSRFSRLRLRTPADADQPPAGLVERRLLKRLRSATVETHLLSRTDPRVAARFVLSPAGRALLFDLAEALPGAIGRSVVAAPATSTNLTKLLSPAARSLLNAAVSGGVSPNAAARARLALELRGEGGPDWLPSTTGPKEKLFFPDTVGGAFDESRAGLAWTPVPPLRLCLDQLVAPGAARISRSRVDIRSASSLACAGPTAPLSRHRARRFAVRATNSIGSDAMTRVFQLLTWRDAGRALVVCQAWQAAGEAAPVWAPGPRGLWRWPLVCPHSHSSVEWRRLYVARARAEAGARSRRVRVPTPIGALVRRRARRHVCPHCGCGRSFAHRSGLEGHLNMHAGRTPHVCRVEGCGKRYSAEASLRAHRKTQHEGPVQQKRRRRVLYCGRREAKRTAKRAASSPRRRTISANRVHVRV